MVLGGRWLRLYPKEFREVERHLLHRKRDPSLWTMDLYNECPVWKTHDKQTNKKHNKERKNAQTGCKRWVKISHTNSPFKLGAMLFKSRLFLIPVVQEWGAATTCQWQNPGDVEVAKSFWDENIFQSHRWEIYFWEQAKGGGGLLKRFPLVRQKQHQTMQEQAWRDAMQNGVFDKKWFIIFRFNVIGDLKSEELELCKHTSPSKSG